MSGVDRSDGVLIIKASYCGTSLIQSSREPESKTYHSKQSPKRKKTDMVRNSLAKFPVASSDTALHNTHVKWSSITRHHTIHNQHTFTEQP